MVISYFFTTFAEKISKILFTNIKKLKYEIKSIGFELMRRFAS